MPEFITDLHLHSKYSRAVSRDMDLEHLDEWAKIKGIHVIGTTDFTYPAWFAELKEKLEPQENGLLKLKGSKNDVFFLLSTEISCIYTKNGKGRRIHVVILAPNLQTVEKINAQLSWRGNIKSDGRPILGMDAKELAKIVLEASPDCLVIPAHAWTPWFSLFGSESGFDTLKECFEELSDQIYAIETGLSSDPAMNWRLKQLDNKQIVSFSDAHSPANIGREATVFELPKLSYQNIVKAIKKPDEKNKIAFTIEFFPEEGKYHWDGHRNCDIRFSPKETLQHKGICPKCGRRLTVGVMYRVEKLADRSEGEKRPNAVPYKSLVPLQEIIGEALGQKKGTKAVNLEYDNLVKLGKNEFNVLINLTENELKKITTPKITEAIIKVRNGQLKVLPGYDGVFGTVKIFDLDESLEKKQAKLF